MNCGKYGVVPFLDLGDQPNGNAFLTEDEIPDEPHYALTMGVCESCWQVQIMEFPDQRVLFDDHPYISGLNAPVVEHFAKLAKTIVDRFDLAAGDVVMDIGCNDGSLLSQFRKLGITGLGIEPGARVNRMARENGHLALRTYWNDATGAALAPLGLRPKVITATAVFYHVPDLHDFISGLRNVMDNETVFVAQAVSLLDIFTGGGFDHFYHEHSCIHSVMALKSLFERNGMTLFDVELSPIHGGSLIAYACLKEAGRAVSPSVDAEIEREKEHGLDKIETYHRFSEEVIANTTAMRDLLIILKNEGATVYGLGAPLKSSTFLNFAKIGPDLLPVLTEVNSFKIGRLAPGTHIPIVDEKTLPAEPGYYLILAWNFLGYFIEKQQSFMDAGGRLIVPVPKPKIISAADVVSGRGTNK